MSVRKASSAPASAIKALMLRPGVAMPNVKFNALVADRHGHGALFVVVCDCVAAWLLEYDIDAVDELVAVKELE
jgi:hypothetical protein